MKEASETLLNILSEAESTMLVTTGEDGMIAARPMRLAKPPTLDAFWFITATDASPARDVDADIRSAVTVQAGRKHASVSGMATLVTDSTKIEELWSVSLRPWFPGGPADPSIVAIKFVPMKGEVWDASGMRGISVLFESVKAIIKGEAVDLSDAGVHSEVTL
jgi:general stress protein 26